MRFQSDRVYQNRPNRLGFACIATKNWKEVKKDFVLGVASHCIGRKKLILTLKLGLDKVREIQEVAHMKMISRHISHFIEIYSPDDGGDDDRIVAIATNPTWGLKYDETVDSDTRYYCLEGVWESDCDTFVVSPEELHRLMAVGNTVQASPTEPVRTE